MLLDKIILLRSKNNYELKRKILKSRKVRLKLNSVSRNPKSLRRKHLRDLHQNRKNKRYDRYYTNALSNDGLLELKWGIENPP